MTPSELRAAYRELHNHTTAVLACLESNRPDVALESARKAEDLVLKLIGDAGPDPEWEKKRAVWLASKDPGV